ncbi:manganese transporter SMF1 [Kluyveromyces marxianus]|uniref:Manganese transporter SMF1 n=1 Tax=Kluyveromyces marxianus TaxID=4911 RepID=A0ABX6EZF7_KLUMA|nr:manganese transporter SMF1 [Kluyveromyces marxianus]BAP71361.1 manganese transporter SMF1 [Kluyveromyces marxianus]
MREDVNAPPLESKTFEVHEEYLDPQSMLELSLAGGASKLSVRQRLYLRCKKIMRKENDGKKGSSSSDDAASQYSIHAQVPNRSREKLGFFGKIKDVLKKYMKFVGPGLMVSVAYMDPGNYATDVSAGASNRFSLLCIVLLSNIIAIFLQSLCIKLGSVTGLDLSRACKKHLPKWLNLIIYVFAECAIIATDIAEVIGSAVALNILLKIPLPAGIIITVIDVLFVLIAYKPGTSSMRFIRMFEYAVALLVFGVVICFIVELGYLPKTSVRSIFRGYVPSKQMFEHNGMYTATSILGATVMPHSLFLGSGLVQPRLLEYDVDHGYYDLLPKEIEEDNESTVKQKQDLDTLREQRYFDYQPTTSAIKYALKYSIAELAITLFTFALFVNSAILIVSGATLYGSEQAVGAGLYTIHDLLSDTLAPIAGTVFMLALLFSGQSAGIVCTIAGQIVSEGHLDWNFKPWKRRLITRGIAIVPCLAVSLAIGKSALNKALNASQVVLSILLPFLIAPLIFFTCKKSIMRVKVNDKDEQAYAEAAMDPDGGVVEVDPEAEETTSGERPAKYIDMSNNWITTIIAFVVWLFISMLNVYTIVQLGISHGDIS